jgi:hypothetical protein
MWDQEESNGPMIGLLPLRLLISHEYELGFGKDGFRFDRRAVHG